MYAWQLGPCWFREGELLRAVKIEKVGLDLGLICVTGSKVWIRRLHATQHACCAKICKMSKAAISASENCDMDESEFYRRTGRCTERTHEWRVRRLRYLAKICTY